MDIFIVTDTEVGWDCIIEAFISEELANKFVEESSIDKRSLFIHKTQLIYE